MFKRLFGIHSNANQLIVDALYEQIVAAARQPLFYSDWQVPDTPLGRFEMLSLNMFLVLRRVRGETGAVRDIAQELVDGFFKEVEHSIRELGIGDMGVPKRMKKLARMFYGRVESYGTAIDAGDQDELAAALKRNIRPDTDNWPEAAALADYATKIAADLARQPISDIAGGTIIFVQPKSAIRSGEAA